MQRALRESVVTGVPTTLSLLEEISHDEVFGSGSYTTAFLTERAEFLPSLGGGAGR
jgi:pyruvate carboxylase